MRLREVNYLFKSMQLVSSEAEIVTHNSAIPKPLAFSKSAANLKDGELRLRWAHMRAVACLLLAMV